MRYDVPLEVRIGSVVTVEAKDSEAALSVAARQWIERMREVDIRVDPSDIGVGRIHEESTRKLGMSWRQIKDDL